jgi:hypothetical protein
MKIFAFVLTTSETFLFLWCISPSVVCNVCAVDADEVSGEERIITAISSVTMKLADRCN